MSLGSLLFPLEAQRQAHHLMIVFKCYAISLVASDPAAFVCLKKILDSLGNLAVIQPMLIVNTVLHLYLNQDSWHMGNSYRVANPAVSLRYRCDRRTF